MTGKERKAQERARVEAAERKQSAWLEKHKAWNWQWPGLGESWFLRNCWFTNASQQRPVSKDPEGNEIHGAQTYYGVSECRKKKRASRRVNGHLSRTGLKFGRAHNYRQADGW